MVLGIIILFVGVSVVPSVMSESQKTSTVTIMKNTWYVDDSGDNGNSGTFWEEAWQHINYAISNDKVSNGDTIMVGDGIYEENLIVDKKLDIIGNGSSNTIIDGNNLDFVIFISYTDEVTISAFGITNGKSIVRIDNSDGCTISKNNIYNDEFGKGVEITDGDENIIFCNEIHHLNVGLQIRNESMNPIDDPKDNQISYNDIHHNYYGIDQMESWRSTIKRNDIHHNKVTGIWLGGSRSDTITENNFEQNPWWQVWPIDSYNVNWNGNFWDNHPGGLIPKFIFGWKTSPYPFFNIDYDRRPSKIKFDTTCP